MPTDQTTPQLPSDSPFRNLRLDLEYQPVDALVAFGRKTRSHTESQIEQLAFTISKVGFVVPLIAKDRVKVIAGHARLEAARRLGLTSVPVIDAKHLTPELARAYAIADNRLAELAGWDTDALRVEFTELKALNLDFPIEITGFNGAQIDALVLAGEGGSERGDVVPRLVLEPTSRLGDLWLLGEHRLLCGDSLEQSSLDQMMAGEAAKAVVTDIPFGLSRREFSSNERHGDFVMGAGEMSSDEFATFCDRSWVQIQTALAPGGLAYFFIDWRKVEVALAGSRAAGLELLNLIVWDKKVGGMGSFYRSQHELVVLAKKPGEAHTNRIQLGVNGRNRTNIWTYTGVGGFGKSKAKARDLHPSVKSLAMIRDAILDCTATGDTVLDLFSGSGTTLIAAHDAGRRGRAIELDPRYVDTGVIRWEAFSGEQARIASSGETFDEVRHRRGRERVERAGALIAETASVEEG